MFSDSDSEGSGRSFDQITINEHYAKAFEYKKEREELQKLKDKYGSDLDDSETSQSDSESDETEDEDGDELTPTVDAAILRTLARIKRKDPSIYDSTTDIFGEEHEKVVPATKRSTKLKDKSKPVTVRQMALQSALDPDERSSASPEPRTHVEEQRALRDETIAAFHDAVENQDEDFLILREKTKDEQELEEEEYRAFLEREVGGDLRKLVDVQPEEDPLVSTIEEGPVSDADPKKGKKKRPKATEVKASKETYSTKSKQESDQEFLMNYILNRGWIDRSTKHIPTYGEITSTNSKKKIKDSVDIDSAFHDEKNDPEALPTEDPDLDEDDFEEIVDRFESSYNFRFEEPDAAVINTYPRNLPSLVRREDTTRKDARERRKQRKAEELQKKKQEVKRLKGLKMKEIRARLERIGREGGKSFEHDKALQGLDLDADWDSAAHDRQMAELYHDDDDVDVEKPQWEDDIDISDIPVDGAEPTNQKKKKKKKRTKDEDDDAGVDVNDMDADVEGNDNVEWDGTEEMRKRVLNEYMDEIYSLDFNDLVGDLPTRFKYTPVQPDNFALTSVEILMATDQELNEYVGIKKFAPYRQAMKWDSKRNERLKELKSKIAERTGQSGFEVSGRHGGADGDRPVKKRKGKKERMRKKAAGADEEAKQTTLVSPSPTKRKRDTDETDGEDDNKQSEGNCEMEKRKRRRKKDKVGA